MRYWKVTWTDGTVRISDPLTTWIDAEMYRRAIGGDARILAY